MRQKLFQQSVVPSQFCQQSLLELPFFLLYLFFFGLFLFIALRESSHHLRLALLTIFLDFLNIRGG